MKKKSTLIICLSLLMVSCTSTTHNVVVESNAKPTETLIPVSTPTQTPNPTPTIIPVPTLSVNLENLDYLAVLGPRYDLFPEGLTYEKLENGFKINWEGKEHFFSCGYYYGKLDPTDTKTEQLWRLNQTNILSPPGYPVTIYFVSAKHDLFNESEQVLAFKEPGVLHLIFDPSVTCNFVVTDKQEEFLNEDDWSKRFEKGTEPYATGKILVDTNGMVYTYIPQRRIIDENGIWPWAYDYKNSVTGKKTTIFGYLYQETGELFTWDKEKLDKSPVVMVDYSMVRGIVVE